MSRVSRQRVLRRFTLRTPVDGPNAIYLSTDAEVTARKNFFALPLAETGPFISIWALRWLTNTFLCWAMKIKSI